MDGLTTGGRFAASIFNDAYMVRHYRRGVSRRLRAQALQKMGATVREAFSTCEDFEPMLYAIAVGLHDPLDPRFRA